MSYIYEDAIDILEEGSQFDFLIESMDYIGLTEGTFKDKFNNVKERIKSFINGVRERVSEIFSNVWDKIKGIFDKSKNTLEEAEKAVEEVNGENIDAVDIVIEEIKENEVQKNMNIQEKCIKAVSEFKEDIKTIAKNANFKDKYNDLKNSTKQVITNMKESEIVKKYKASTFNTKYVTTLKNEVNKTYKYLEQNVKNSKTFNDILQKTNQVIDNLKDTYGDSYNDFVAKSKDFMQNTRNAFTTIQENIKVLSSHTSNCLTNATKLKNAALNKLRGKRNISDNNSN